MPQSKKNSETFAKCLQESPRRQYCQHRQFSDFYLSLQVLGVGILASAASEVKCDELDSLAESNGINTGFSGNDLCNAAKDNTGIAMGVLVVIGVFIVTLPLIYLYWWIVVNSLRKRIVEDKRQILPVQQPVVFATTQQPPPYPTGYQDDLSKY